VFLAFLPFVFNLADAAITLGGSLLAVRLVGQKEEKDGPFDGHR
jgi:lipoprotein signal peptidase